MSPHSQPLYSYSLSNLEIASLFFIYSFATTTAANDNGINIHITKGRDDKFTFTMDCFLIFFIFISRYKQSFSLLRRFSYRWFVVVSMKYHPLFWRTIKGTLFSFKEILCAADRWWWCERTIVMQSSENMKRICRAGGEWDEFIISTSPLCGVVPTRFNRIIAGTMDNSSDFFLSYFTCGIFPFDGFFCCWRSESLCLYDDIKFFFSLKVMIFAEKTFNQREKVGQCLVIKNMSHIGTGKML